MTDRCIINRISINVKNDEKGIICMKVKICKNDFSLQWQGTYHLALVDYPEINKWELEKLPSSWDMKKCTIGRLK